MIDQFYQQYSAEITRFIMSRGASREDAEDVCAQVFLEAMRYQPEGEHVRAWLYQVARHRWIDRDRADRRRQAAPLDELTASVDAPEAHDSLSRTALLLLSPAQQRVIEARFLHGHELQEIAQDIGVSIGAVKALQHRALARLRDIAVRPTPPNRRLTHDRNWAADEDARLRLGIAQGWSDAVIGSWLGRSAVAIHVRAGRLGISRRAPTTGSASEVARALGVKCAKTITKWATLGWLPVQRSSDQHGAKWRFLWNDVWAFLENPAYWMAWHPERLADPARRTWALELRKGQPQWLTPGQVAQRCYVFRNVVNDWIIRFGLKATRYGNWWVNERDLVDWVPPGERPRAPRKPGVYHKRPRLPKSERQIVRGPHAP